LFEHGLFGKALSTFPDLNARAKLAKVASIAACSTVHGYAKLAPEGQSGSLDSEAGRREFVATLRQVLNYLWPLEAARRRSSKGGS
jgi:hypothetical protein